jgi:hypothetical protein
MSESSESSGYCSILHPCEREKDVEMKENRPSEEFCSNVNINDAFFFAVKKMAIGESQKCNKIIPIGHPNNDAINRSRWCGNLTAARFKQAMAPDKLNENK